MKQSRASGPAKPYQLGIEVRSSEILMNCASMSLEFPDDDLGSAASIWTSLCGFVLSWMRWLTNARIGEEVDGNSQDAKRFL